jgi:hypothetical protein
MTPEQKIDDLENRDIKNLVAAVRETSAMGREAEELLNKCRERKHEIAEKFIDQEALVAELQARVNYLEVYKVGPSRRLEKSHWEKLFGKVFDWEEGAGLLPAEVTRAAILDRLILAVDLLEAVQLEADNGIESAESRDTQTNSEAQQALERIAEMIGDLR